MPSHLLLFLLLPLAFSPATSLSDPPTTLLNKGCSQYNASDLSLNSIFSDLRSQLSNSSLFATSHTPPADSNTPIYSMFYCRPYLSLPSCLSCFANASAVIRTCGSANGARVILNGCFLRYESLPFYNQTTAPGNSAICSNASSNNGSEVASLMVDLAAVTNRVNGYFAAAVGNGVYGVAECVQTISESGCNDCLQVAVANVNGCLGKKEGAAVDVGCFMRFSDADFFGDYPTVNLQSLLSSSSGKSSNKGAIIGGAVGGSFLILLALLLFLWLRKSKKSKNGRRGNILGATELRGPVNFRYKDLKSATKNFSDENKLGEGGFGDVYKGVLKNGNIVAVKKLAISQTNRAKADFQTEVTLISNIHHRNLVRLLGCSSKGPDLLLVYEYMTNSSLDKFLFGEGEKIGTLSWKQRYDIIVGIARGIAYLHQEFHVTVIHRDIKSSNILLDDDLQPKIADFGLARLLPGDQTHVSTRFAGTLGYTAPEYAIHGQLSEKVDTYSFGVVLLEIVSGRKSNDPKLEVEYQYLLEWAWRLYESHELIKLVDEYIDPNEFNEDELKRVIEIALLCTQSTVAARPTMSEVVISLLSTAGPSVVPTRPTFIDAVNRVRGDASTSSNSSNPTNATISITQMSAR